MNRVKVDLKAAIEFAAQGFEIECYVTGTQTDKKIVRKARLHIKQDAIMALSVEGRAPVKGAMRDSWPKIKHDLFGNDVTATYTRAEVEVVIERHSPNTGWLFSALVRKGLLREVGDE